MVKVFIPTPLRTRTDGHSEVEVAGTTVAEGLQALIGRHPGLMPQLFDSEGRLRSFVVLFLNNIDIRITGGLSTPITAGDTLEILPAIAGGSGDDTLTGAEWSRRLRSEIAQVEPADLKPGADPVPIILDVRTSAEWSSGHLPGAIHLDRGFLELRIEDAVPDRSTPIICYCQSGVRSLYAAKALQHLGYRSVRSLAGGVTAWKEAGREIVRPVELDDAQRRRYARHLAIPEVGDAGQAKLLGSRVLIVGTGGLGCPVALYLAAAGVGTMALIDDDMVEESNLQRQVLHTQANVGILKVDSAETAIKALNPTVKVVKHPVRLTSGNADALLAGYDVVVDGSDNFSTRYLINDTCVRLGVPLVHGSVYRFEGQVAVFNAAGGPCYRCLYPDRPPSELAPSCAEAGVLGAIPGIIGLLQANEALKLLLGVGDPLSGRAIRFDALGAKMRELRFARDPDCTACGRTLQHVDIDPMPSALTA